MNKYDYLRKHALKNVFISPTQDRQSVVRPVRITPEYGRKKFATVDQWGSVQLPDATSSWHVYQIGGVHPVVFNYFIKCDAWTSLAETSNERAMLAEVYVASGIQLPRFDTFYRYTENNSLIVAVKINSALPVDFDRDAVFVRVYSNAYFNSVRSAVPGPKIVVYGKHVTAPSDIIDLMVQEALLTAVGDGLVSRYINGVLVNDFEDYAMEEGDAVELVFDRSVQSVVEWQVKTLPAFESVLDSKRKLLLHRPKTGSFQIDYHDDTDIYLVQKLSTPTGPIERGVYYHRNEAGSVRNLTHQDYSIVSSQVRHFGDTIEGLTSPRVAQSTDEMWVRMHIRKSGVLRTLQYEHHRVRELYRLDDEKIVQAMVGLNSTVRLWQAATLESSGYMEILRSTYNSVTSELAETAYMYNASSKYLGDTPMKITPNAVLQSIELPLRARHGCTVYEYDAGGLLLSWHHHYTGLHYFVRNALTAYTEVIIGWGGQILDEFPNTREYTLNDVYNYRVYLGKKVGTTISDYRDVTGTDSYEVVDGVFKWKSTVTTDFPLLRSDARFYSHDYEVMLLQGQIEIDLSVLQNRGTGVSLYNLDVPLGQIDVFLNRKSLIRGLDYFYHRGRVFITNKEFLVDPLRLKQRIHIRFTGFCKSDLSIMDEGDVGFIEHGLLSNNNRYDIRDDKVQRVLVGGRLYHKDDLIFSEDHTGVSVLDVNNGLPYMVKDLLVPVKPYTFTDTYSLRDASIEVDQAVSDYMTKIFPQPARGALVAISQRYEIFSPFLTKLIMDLRLGYLRLAPTATGYTRQEVLAICKPYEHLLESDPLRSPNAQDVRYVVIQPHPMPYVIELNISAYQFMHKVVSEYCRGLVSLSPCVRTV